MALKNEKDRIHSSKAVYDSIKIPEELDGIVSGTVNFVEKTRSSYKKPSKHLRYAAMAAASILICFTISLNTLEAFAAAVSRIPVLGTISAVLTLRNYEKTDQDKTITVKVPVIRPGTQDKKDYIIDVNSKIQAIVDQYEKDAQKRIEEYKEAFISTGGTEEEFAHKDIKANVNYSITYESEQYLSFILEANENWCDAYGLHYFYNINLLEDKPVELRDLLGEDYISIAGSSIKKQMAERMAANENLVYWDGSNGIEGFDTIDGSTQFYINQKGNPVIVFDKYEVAPGAFGQQEFEILH